MSTPGIDQSEPGDTTIIIDARPYEFISAKTVRRLTISRRGVEETYITKFVMAKTPEFIRVDFSIHKDGSITYGKR